LTAPILAVHNKTAQTVIPKSIVPDPGWFNSDWWREIQLFLKSNRVVATNDKITTVLA